MDSQGPPAALDPTEPVCLDDNDSSSVPSFLACFDDDNPIPDEGLPQLTEVVPEGTAAVGPAALRAARREALCERLEWAAARPMSPGAAACDLLEPLTWVFDLIAARTPDPWGPDGGRVAWRVLRILETVAAPSDRLTAAILEWALHFFGEAVKGDDETTRGASALVASGKTTDSTWRSGRAQWRRRSWRRRCTRTRSGTGRP